MRYLIELRVRSVLEGVLIRVESCKEFVWR